MRKLTFKGFLTQYVRELSTQGTLSLYRLAKEAEHENPRLREPLTLYALFCGQAHVLCRAAKGDWRDREVLDYTPEQLMPMLDDEHSELSENYKKVYRSYCAVASKQQTDDNTKLLLLKRTRRRQSELGVSNYRLYRDLGLNPGNVNAYLKHGDTGKVSLETARRLYDAVVK